MLVALSLDLVAALTESVELGRVRRNHLAEAVTPLVLAHDVQVDLLVVLLVDVFVEVLGLRDDKHDATLGRDVIITLGVPKWRLINVTVTLSLLLAYLLVKLLLQAKYLLSQRMVVLHRARTVMDSHLTHEWYQVSWPHLWCRGLNYISGSFVFVIFYIKLHPDCI